MSLGEAGKQIHCDGKGCKAVVAVPVALRSQLTRHHYGTPTVAGWLFVVSNESLRHFCPQCTLNHLGELDAVERSDVSPYAIVRQYERK